MGHPHFSKTSRRLVLSIGATLLFVIIEAVAGSLAHSLALLSDAGHNLADALALILSWYGLWIAGRPSSASRTFGFHRVGILTALANAVSLVVIAIVIFWQAAHRLTAAPRVDSTVMILVAVGAIAMNLGIGFALKHGAHDLNIRSAYLHLLSDAASAFGVVIAGLVIRFTGLTLADPIVSFLIGGLILYSSWEVLLDAVNVLLEATPRGLDMAALERTLRQVEGVLNVHDLHVWTLASGIVACSCHIQVTEQSIRSGQQVLAKVVEALEHDFSITHTTVQVEVEGCAPNDMFCTLRRVEEGGPGQQGHSHSY